MLEIILNLFLVLNCVTVTFSDSENLSYRNCTEGPGSSANKSAVVILKSSLTNCTRDPCVIEKARTYEGYVMARVDFHLNISNVLDMLVYTVTQNFGPVQFYSDELCQHLKGQCNNTVPGSIIEARSSQRVSDLFPVFSGDFRIVVRRDTVPIFCCQIGVIVTDRPPTMKETMDRVSGLEGFGGLIPG